MNAIKNLSTRAKAIVTTAGLGLASGTGYMTYDHYNFVGAAEAISRPVGEEVKVKLTVQEAKDFGPRIGLLLSDVPYRDSVKGVKMHTVHISPAASGYTTNPATFLGKNVYVRGKVSEYRGQKQIEAEEVTVK